VSEGQWFGAGYLCVLGDKDLADRFTNDDQLRCAGFGMGFEFARFGPDVGLIVMVDVAEKQALGGAVNDDAEVETDADGVEVLVFGFFEFVELQAGVGGVELEIEGGDFGGFLLFAGEL
jgi:hypothetical protein